MIIGPPSRERQGARFHTITGGVNMMGQKGGISGLGGGRTNEVIAPTQYCSSHSCVREYCGVLGIAHYKLMSSNGVGAKKVFSFFSHIGRKPGKHTNQHESYYRPSHYLQLNIHLEI